MRRSLRLIPVLAALAAAFPPGLRAADSVAPAISNFAIKDCEGNLQENQVITSTGLTDVRVRVFDLDTTTNTGKVGMGVRVGRVQHVGHTAASANLINLMHFDGNATSSDTAPNNGTASGVVACGDRFGHTDVLANGTGLVGDNCWTWDSGGDFVRINASPTLNSTTSQITLQAWIKPSNLLAPYPVLEFNNAVNIGPHLWIGTPSAGNNGNLYANLVDTMGVTQVVASTGGFVKSDVWQLVTLTYNAGTARLYYNNVEVASRTIHTRHPLQTAYDLNVGYRPSGTAVTFNGSIDEVRVLNRALSDDEVEGDPYGGVLFYKTTTADTQFRQIKLLPGTHYTPAIANGFQVPATATVTNLQLKPGTGNQLAFSFQDLVGNTGRSQIGITVIESVPDSPVSVTAGGVTTSGITWSWARGTRLCLAAGGGGGQFVGRRPDTGTVVYPASTVTTFAEVGLTANTLYGLQVQASDAFGLSPLSAPASAYTLATAPTAFGAASVSTGSAVLSWSSTNPNYTRFEVTLSTDNFAASVSTPVPLTNNLTALTTSLAALTPQTTYFVRIRAFNGRASDSGTAGTAYTAALTGQFNTLPAAPGTLGATPLGASSITWNWNLVPTATSYTLEASTGGVLARTSGNSHTVVNLTPNASYGARLRAHNLTGAGDFGPIVNTFTDPQPPTGTALASVGTSTVRVTWNGNSNPAGTSYQLQVATLAGFGTVFSAISASQTEATIVGLLPASTYYARVRASGFNGSQTPFDTALSFVTSSFGAISSTSSPPTPYAVSGPEVAVYHFDEAGGTRAVDSSGKGNHLALTGTISSSSPTFVSGPTGLGTALRFPGLIDSVSTAPHSASLAGTGDLTVHLWVNPAASLQVQDAGVVVKGTGTEETFMLDVSTALKWRFAVRDAAGVLYAVFSTQTLTPNAWAHVAGVYKSGGSPSLSLYVDGVLSAAQSAAPAARRTTVNSLSVGNRRSAASSFDRAFRGDLDELHIATVALTATEVGQAYAASRSAEVVGKFPNDGVRVLVPPNAFGGAAVILMSSSPLTVPISILPSILSDGVNSPPSGQTLVPNSVFEIVANINGSAFTGQFGSTVTLGLPYPDSDGNGLVDGTSPPIAVSTLKMYTLNTAVTQWEALPSTVDTSNRRVLGQTTHFSVFAIFGPTGIRPNTNQVRLYPRPWKPSSGGKFDSATFGGRTGVAIDNLTTSGRVRIFTLSGELVRDLAYGAVNVGTVIWDGTNEAGARAASGVYFAVVLPDDGEEVVLKFAVER